MEKVIINLRMRIFEKLVGKQIGVSELCGKDFFRKVIIEYLLLMLRWIISGYMWTGTC